MFKQITKDLITKNNHLCYFVSSDFIIKENTLNDFINIKDIRNNININDRYYPNCILVNNIFSLVIKDKFYSKPSIYNISKSLILLKQKVIENDIKNICILLNKNDIKYVSIDDFEYIINSLFKETDINITMYLDANR